jgi:hypothetical protein
LDGALAARVSDGAIWEVKMTHVEGHGVEGATQHARFIARLRASKPGVFAFAYWLSSRGYWVEIAPTREAPCAAEHPQYIDQGDLFAWKEGGPRLRIEVKTLSVTFSGRNDWPYPNVFVASAMSVDRAIDEVYAWVSVSHDLGAAVMMEATTFGTWTRTTKTASNTGNDEIFYAAPMEGVKFIKLAQS